jgi:hypothetical protein
MIVLNPRQAAYAQFERDFRRGEMNPNQNMPGLGRYYTISTGYSDQCSLNSPYYAVRKNGVITSKQ